MSNPNEPDPAPRPRSGARARPIAAVVAAILAVAAVGSAFVVAQGDAADRQAASAAEHEEAAESVADLQAELDAATDEASDAAALAEGLGDLPDAYVDPDAEVELAEAAALVAAELAESEALPEPAPEARPIASGSFGELAAASRRLDAEARRLRELGAELDAAADELRSAAERATEAGDAVLESIPRVADALDEQHESARNLDRLAFREAAAVVDAAERLDGGALDAIGAYVAAADALVASHEAEEAEKAGPLYDRRKEVEAFARDLANGVLLEFDWAPVVRGYGEGGTYGGTATWDVRGGGISTIAFSDSVADLWDAPSVRALVAHEVGHAMTGRCLGTIVPDDLAYVENEAWATAWAISMEYEGDGSGEWVYGRPSDDLIALAERCR